MNTGTTRITPVRVIEIEGLGNETVECTDAEAERFEVQHLVDGRWLVDSDHHTTRASAEAAS